MHCRVNKNKKGFNSCTKHGVTIAIACQFQPPLSTIPLCSVDREEAVAWGPNHDSPPLCLSCLSPVTGDFVCPDCGLPLCDEICARGEHSRWECRIFRERKLVVNITDFTGSYSPFYQSVTALRSDNTLSTLSLYSLYVSPRCLMLKRDDPVKWNSLKVRVHSSHSPHTLWLQFS